jgi:hypothetical protein
VWRVRLGARARAKRAAKEAQERAEKGGGASSVASLASKWEGAGDDGGSDNPLHAADRRQSTSPDLTSTSSPSDEIFESDLTPTTKVAASVGENTEIFEEEDIEAPFEVDETKPTTKAAKKAKKLVKSREKQAKAKVGKTKPVAATSTAAANKKPSEAKAVETQPEAETETTMSPETAPPVADRMAAFLAREDPNTASRTKAQEASRRAKAAKAAK